MITLAATDSIQATASANTAITSTLSGDELTVATGVDAFKTLDQRQLTTSIVSLYTPGTGKSALVKEWVLANTTAGAVTVTLYRNGAVAANQTAQMSIPANGQAIRLAAGWNVYDANGILVTSVAGTAASKNLGNSVIDPGTGALEVALPIQAQLVTTSKTYALTDLDKMWPRANGGTPMTDTLPVGNAATNGMRIYIANDDVTAALTLTAGAGQSFVSATGGVGASTFVIKAARRTEFIWNNGGGFWRIGINNNNLTKGKVGTTFTLGNIPIVTTNTDGSEIDDSGINVATINAKVASVAAADTSITVAGTATAPTLSRAALTSDVTAPAGSNVTTLATVNSNVGTFGSTTRIPTYTVNGKGLTTASSDAAILTTPAGQTPVGATRSIATTAPLTGGGDLSADRTLALSAGSPGQTFNYFPSTAAWAAVDQVFNIQAFGADPTGVADCSLAIYNAIICCGIQKGATKQVITTAQVTTGTTFSISVQANTLPASGTLMAQTTLGLIGFTYTGGGTATLAATTTYGVTGGLLLSGSIIGVPTTTSIGGIVYSPAGFYINNNQVINSIPGVQFIGVGSNNNHDTGSWPQGGGSWWSYRGTAGGANLINVPGSGSNGIQGGQALGGIKIMDMNFECSGTSGYGNAGYGVLMISCNGYHMENLFVFNALKSAYEFTTVGAGILGEAADCTRGTHINLKFRELEGKSTAANISASGLTNPAATTNLNALAASTVTVSGAPNANWDTSGLAKFQAIDQLTGTVMWYLVSYTGISGSTLTGCTAVNQWYNQTNSTTLNANTPASGNPKPNALMFAGSKIVPAQGAFSEGFTWHGSATANACCSTFIQIQGTYWMGTALFSGNSDSNTIIRPMFNRTTAGTPTGIGVELHGSTLSGSSGASGSTRNQFFISGDPGLGGVVVRGTDTLGYLQPSSTNRWDYYELGNGAPVPVVGTGAHFIWEPNGGFAVGVQQVSVAAQATAASFTGFVTGSTIVVPPQGFQIGTTFKWVVPVSKTAAGTTYSVAVRYGTTNAFGTDTTAIATFAVTGTAVADTGQLEITMVVATLGASATAFAQLFVKHAATITGLATVNGFTGTMAAFASTSENPGPAYLNLAITANAANVFTFNAPVTAEVTHAANP